MSRRLKSASGVFQLARVRAKEPRLPAYIEEPLTTLTIRHPDAWHLHLRERAVLKAVSPFEGLAFSRASAGWLRDRHFRSTEFSSPALYGVRPSC